MAEQLVVLPIFAKLSERVWRVLGLNPGKFTLQGTNTYLVGLGSTKTLLDTGEGKPDYVPTLMENLSAQSATINRILVSHHHQDHWGGVPSLLSALPNAPTIHKFPDPETDPSLPFTFEDLRDNQYIKVDDETTLRVVYAPGHTKDHCCFYLEEEGALFTADAVLGQGTAVFEDLAVYMASLRNLVTIQPKRLYPGHGPIIEDGVAKIQEYIHHRDERENQILQTLKSRSPANNTEWSVIELVRAIYKGYPEAIYPAAGHGVILHLRKLEKEGRAVRGQTENILSNELEGRWTWNETDGKL